MSRTLIFPVAAILVSLLALRLPGLFAPLGAWVTPLLAAVMFLMGVKLTIADFRRVARRPAPVLAGIVLHYAIMPAAAWLIARLLHLPPLLGAGLILVGSVASGTASTVMVFLARGDVALSVSIGAVSTLIGVVATPVLTRLYVSADVAVHGWAMLLGIVEVVALPVLAGVVVNRLASRLVERLSPAFPVLSMVVVLLIIGVVVASAHAAIGTVEPALLLAVALHNGIGLLGGYWGGRALGFDEAVCRTLALEVGMQNSGLAAALARSYVAPLAALPAALFSVWHNLSGSVLAAWWGRTSKSQSAD
ncbi:bile acid:sodium symporter family protein [Acetobacteraceae bacterium KSS8]|uniref:Bile acid:sodium symporter family protein n=1 Tax=Endosaccharibacter trunci TaxID=2812733 RepID=A0ABT1W6H5_9PROT|nr:bile acid:sodium symporter family protein [Acetobacteraceae bacterium KSS8]